ncbi:MAG: hypothetical protein M3Y84_05225, partial [Acidobacteriota bacterium]|nr:hypothetical protein [Acidobacteriota bacterium]
MRAFAEKQNLPQQQLSAKTTRSKTVATAASHQAQLIPNLQRTIGNQAVLQLLRGKLKGPEVGSDTEGGANTEVYSKTPTMTRFAHDSDRTSLHAPSPITIQAKLAVNTSGDVFEHEADHLAEQVMRIPEPQLQRACACGG